MYAEDQDKHIFTAIFMFTSLDFHS